MDVYDFKGIELTPNVFKTLMIRLLDGKQFERQSAIDIITEYHKSNGGILQNGNYIGTFKHSCQMLKGYGLSNVGYGVWRLNYNEKDTNIIKPETRTKKKYCIHADKETGDGNDAIYIYYYDTYKKLAALEERPYWECKIGRTSVQPINRIIDQTGTCSPEPPHIALIIHCEDSVLLESTLHNIIKMRKRWIPNAPGTEWFMTSPDEIELIYKAITS